MRNKILLLVVSLITVFGLPATISACSCLPVCSGFETPKQCAQKELKYYPGAISGKVISITKSSQAGYYVARFEVTRSWKYRVAQYVDVTSYYDNGANCGSNLKLGDERLLFATLKSETEASVSGCEVAGTDSAKYLGKGSPPKMNKK